MTKDVLIEKIKQGGYTQATLLKWVQGLPNELSGKTDPKIPMVGDVYFHPIFGHPYVLLEYRGDDWLCGLLTSDSDCSDILCGTESRFFYNSYFTNVLFTVNYEIAHKFRGVYENKRHLKKVLKQLKSIFR